MNIRTLGNLKIANVSTIIKEFSNSNPNLTKCSSNIPLQEDWHQNLLFSLLLTFHIKIFEEVLYQLHGNYKQDI